MYSWLYVFPFHHLKYILCHSLLACRVPVENQLITLWRFPCKLLNALSLFLIFVNLITRVCLINRCVGFIQYGTLMHPRLACVSFPMLGSFSFAAAKSLQSCPTLCDPIDGNRPGSPVSGILQARTLEWVAISFSNAGTWKVKVKLLSRVDCSWPHGLQPTSLLHPWDFPGKSTGVGCHCLLRLFL